MASLLTHAVIDEFSRIEQIKGSAPAMYSPRLPAVARSPWRWPTALPGEWMGVDDLFTTMRSTTQSHHRAQRDGTVKLYLKTTTGSPGYAGYHDWTLLEGATPWPCCSSMPAPSG